MKILSSGPGLGLTSMVGRASIRLRLFASFGILLTLMLVVSVVALQRLNALTVAIDHLSGQQARGAALAQQANQYTQRAAVYLLRLLQTPSRSDRAPLYSGMDAAMAMSSRAMADLTMSGVAGTGGKPVERLLGVRHAFEEAFLETVDLVEVEGLAAAREHFDAKTDPLMAQLIDAASMMAEQQQQQVQARAEELKSDAARARLVILLLAPTALMLGGGLAIAIGRSISGPIQSAANIADAIAGGRYTCHIPEGSGPELTTFMRALRAMRDNIASREKRILDLAYVDVLTNLPNRTHFVEAVTRAVGESIGAVLICDVNRFAPINNALGYQVGDQLLREVGDRLLTHVGSAGVVARLGADEFAVLLPGSDEAAAISHAQSILATMHAPLSIGGQRLDVDASIGIVMFPRDGENATDLLRHGDLALALAKRRHEGFALGSDVADKSQHEQLTLIGEMRQALSRNEFEPYFQPKQELSTGRIIGAEALLRWRHPQRGLVPPGTFIPFAEHTGFIKEITPWLLASVIRQCAEWYRAGLRIVTSINISTLDLTGRRLVIDMERLLREHRLPPGMVCLEITESALMDDPEIALRHLCELADLGVKLSIDDYGTGQASLGYVQRLPVHELKIDRAFVDQVDSRAKSAAIIRSTILLCEELGLLVVAEGVETPAEMEWLAANRCAVVQGYRIARPMPADVFIDWVGDRGAAS